MNRLENIQRLKKIKDTKDARKIECPFTSIKKIRCALNEFRDQDYAEIQERDKIYKVNIYSH